MVVVVTSMPVIGVVAIEKCGVVLENARKIERADIQHTIERYLSLTSAHDRSLSINCPQPVLDVRKIIGSHEIGLVEQHYIGECNLLAGLVRLLELTLNMLRINKC